MHLDSLRGMTMYAIPIMKFGSMRETANYHAGKALLEASRGDLAQAEVTLREIVSVGSLLAHEGTFLIEALIGSVLMNIGTDALEYFYRANGRVAEADAIRLPRETLDRLTKATEDIVSTGTNSQSLQVAMNAAANRDMPRGIRWETLMTLQLSSSCLNANTAVFGRGDEYLRWLGLVRSDLVRYPSDQALFEVMLRGLSEDTTNTVPAIGRLLGLTLGRRGAANTCAAMLSALPQM